jgi:hypothetical protein
LTKHGLDGQCDWFDTARSPFVTNRPASYTGPVDVHDDRLPVRAGHMGAGAEWICARSAPSASTAAIRW